MFVNLEKSFKKKGVRSKLYIRRSLADTKYHERQYLTQNFVKLEEKFTELKEIDSELSEEEEVNYLLPPMPQYYDGIITALETVTDF